MHQSACRAAAVAAALAFGAPSVYASLPLAEELHWEILVPSARVGSFALRIERAQSAAAPEELAARIAHDWEQSGSAVRYGDDPAAASVSRLLVGALETVTLRVAGPGRVALERSVLEWDTSSRLAPGPGSARQPLGMLTEFNALGEPASSFTSTDGDTANLTRIWLLPGEVQALAARVERLAARQGMRAVLRFAAPGDGAVVRRGDRVLAFAGQGRKLVASLLARGEHVALVVHCQGCGP